MPKKRNAGGCRCCGPVGIVNCARCTNGLIPATLFLTDANGTHTLHRVIGTPEWRCCYTVTDTNARSAASFCATPVTATVAIGYILQCPPAAPAAGAFRLFQGWSACSGTQGASGACTGDNAGFVSPGGASLNTAPQANSSVVVPNCRPINLTFTMASAYLNGTITITE